MISIQLTFLVAEALISGLPTAVRLGGRKQYYDRFPCANPGGGGAPYNGLYGEAPPGKGTFFRPQIYERVGISQNEVYKRVRGNRSFRYLKGPLIIIFRIDAKCGCISLFI